MKKTGIVVLFACVALIPCAGYADKASSAEQRDERAGPVPFNAPRSDRKASVKSRPRKQLPKPSEHRPPPRAMNPRRGSSGSSPTARGPVIQNPIAGRSRPSRQPVTAGNPAPLLSSVRHHSPNPPVIDGAANLSKRNTGSIDGRQVHRRP